MNNKKACIAGLFFA